MVADSCRWSLRSTSVVDCHCLRSRGLLRSSEELQDLENLQQCSEVDSGDHHQPTTRFGSEHHSGHPSSFPRIVDRNQPSSQDRGPNQRFQLRPNFRGLLLRQHQYLQSLTLRFQLSPCGGRFFLGMENKSSAELLQRIDCIGIHHVQHRSRGDRVAAFGVYFPGTVSSALCGAGVGSWVHLHKYHGFHFRAEVVDCHHSSGQKHQLARFFALQQCKEWFYEWSFGRIWRRICAADNSNGQCCSEQPINACLKNVYIINCIY